MICVDDKVIRERAAKLPVSYLDDCTKVAIIRPDDGAWCFDEKDFYAIRKQYNKYARSEVDVYVLGEPISGCCDRADQY